MGIFNKKPAKLPKGEGKAEDIKKIELGNGIEAIEGKFPEGFDPTNPDQLREFLGSVLKDAGVLPEGADIESMELVKVSPNGKGKMAGVATINNSRKGEATKAVLKEAAARFKSMEGKPVPMIAEPLDPAKALFIGCLNQLHKQVHGLAPMAADLYSSLECLHMTMKASNPDGMGRAKFKAFELAVAGMMEQMAKFGEEVCSLAEKVERSGVPVPDGSSATVN